MTAIGLKERQAPDHGNLEHPMGIPMKQKSGVGLLLLSILSPVIKWGSAAAFIYVLLWCLDNFGILKRLLWVAE